MKTPNWFRAALAEQTPRLMAGDTTRTDAITAIKERALLEHDDLPGAVWSDFIDRHLSAWEKQHRPQGVGEESYQGELFPELPGWVETGIGKRTHQSVMNAHDWDAGLKQAETKADNVQGYLDRFRTAYDQVRPLFKDEIETTAEAMARAGLLAAAGGA